METPVVLNLEKQLSDIRNQLSINEDQIENKKRFLEISEKLPVGIIELNNELKIINSNDNIKHFFGYTFKDLKDQSIVEYIHPDDLSTVEEKISLINRGFLGGPYEYRIFASNGMTIKSLILSSPIYTQNILTGIKCCIINYKQYKDLEEKTFKPENLTHKQTQHQAIKFSSLNSDDDSYCQIDSKTNSMANLNNSIKKIANIPTTVLISGETGTGKEIIAKRIHQSSNRKEIPLITVNCGALPDNLLESVLFGHKKGSFTDAKEDKKGLFEQANKGTIFLDEIGEMPLNMQVKLLRVLQEKKVRPIGSSEEIEIDVKILAATNKNLEKLVKEGSFREDLFYRIKVVHLQIPPLKERKYEIPVLSNYFIKHFNSLFSKNICQISSEALDILCSYNFPGNIRELKHLIEFACIFCNSDTINIENFPDDFRTKISLPESRIKPKSETEEKEEIIKVLSELKGNKSQAAKKLGIHRTTLIRKLQKYKILDKDIIAS